MPQGPIAVSTNQGGSRNTLNVSAPTLIRTGSGRLATIVVNVSSASVGSANDVSTVAGASSSNAIFQIPANAPVGSVYPLNFPVSAGLVISPGAGGTVAIAWS